MVLILSEKKKKVLLNTALLLYLISSSNHKYFEKASNVIIIFYLSSFFPPFFCWYGLALVEIREGMKTKKMSYRYLDQRLIMKSVRRLTWRLLGSYLEMMDLTSLKSNRLMSWFSWQTRIPTPLLTLLFLPGPFVYQSSRSIHSTPLEPVFPSASIATPANRPRAYLSPFQSNSMTSGTAS